MQNPLQDVTLKIPIRYDAPFKFVDLAEAVDLQASARFQNELKSLLDLKLELIKSNDTDFYKDLYPESEMFIECKLSDINALQVDGYTNYGELYFMLETVNQNDMPFFLTQMIVDHCFKSEIEKYSPDSFYKIENSENDDYYLVHEDERDLPVIANLLNKNYTEQLEVVLHYHVVFSDLIDFDIKTAIMKHTLKLLNNVPNLFKLSIHFDSITTDDLKQYTDDNNDEYDTTQLSELPVFRSIFQSMTLDDNSDKQHAHFIFYPLTPNDETFDKLVNTGLEMDPTSSNFLSIGEWGSVYFPLLNEFGNDGRYEINEKTIAEAFWRFDESLLDSIGVPVENLSLHVRMDSFKRYMTIQYLTKFSGLLYDLKRKLKSQSLSVWSMKRIAELFTESLALREKVLKALKNKETFEALTTSEKMIDRIKLALTE
ncbi:hypothetical protein CANINC_002458 [Pichia inconspicua]|uniref:Uncharacterized protein n=1 Tax=Pichia inconspicua TaxID=52247 RepID=A0A4T0X1J3_9ASCO|nr:hypothetical protein CANINC_002458 [[Candida] inconspicua]